MTASGGSAGGSDAHPSTVTLPTPALDRWNAKHSCLNQMGRGLHTCWVRHGCGLPRLAPGCAVMMCVVRAQRRELVLLVMMRGEGEMMGCEEGAEVLGGTSWLELVRGRVKWVVFEGPPGPGCGLWMRWLRGCQLLGQLAAAQRSMSYQQPACCCSQGWCCGGGLGYSWLCCALWGSEERGRFQRHSLGAL